MVRMHSDSSFLPISGADPCHICIFLHVTSCDPTWVTIGHAREDNFWEAWDWGRTARETSALDSVSYVSCGQQEQTFPRKQFLF